MQFRWRHSPCLSSRGHHSSYRRHRGRRPPDSKESLGVCVFFCACVCGCVRVRVRVRVRVFATLAPPSLFWGGILERARLEQHLALAENFCLVIVRSVVSVRSFVRP